MLSLDMLSYAVHQMFKLTGRHERVVASSPSPIQSTLSCPLLIRASTEKSDYGLLILFRRAGIQPELETKVPTAHAVTRWMVADVLLALRAVCDCIQDRFW
jgi:hypothetical protein